MFNYINYYSNDLNRQCYLKIKYEKFFIEIALT